METKAHANSLILYPWRIRMDYNEFLDKLIDKGIEAAKRDYHKPKDKDKREGAVAGFEACRGKSPLELRDLCEQARVNTHRAMTEELPDYWRHRCFECEIGWVCNCVSAILMNTGLGTLGPYWPTARAVMTVAEIVGVKEPVVPR